jgi:hypothetical protein
MAQQLQTAVTANTTAAAGPLQAFTEGLGRVLAASLTRWACLRWAAQSHAVTI